VIKKRLFIDRDGTIIQEPKVDFQIDQLDKFRFLPGAIYYLSKIAREFDFEFYLITNQDGLGTDSFPSNTFWPYQDLMIQTLQDEGIVFKEVFIDDSFESDNSPSRKPATGMVEHLISSTHKDQSYVIGDRATDVQLASNIGCKSITINHSNDKAIANLNSWESIYEYLKSGYRYSEVVRKTNETDILIRVSMLGKGKHQIDTGIGFFDHMLDQIARHSGFDLTIIAKGDLHIDKHHTIEDVGIALGEAFYKLWQAYPNVERYGFLLPMDDSIAKVAVDFGGRPWCVWKVKFKHKKIGKIPTEMFFHFFKSFCDHAKCNLYIKAKGKDDHHKIESIFKAFAKACKMALTANDTDVLPTTKGML